MSSAWPRSFEATSSSSSSPSVGANVTEGAAVVGMAVGTGETEGAGETVGATLHVDGRSGAASSQYVKATADPSSSTHWASRQPSSPRNQW